jgi:hypothetical protein
MNMKTINTPANVLFRKTCSVLTLLWTATTLPGMAPASPGYFLQEQFINPPREALPSAFWPWIGGHITREGIQADLEAMKSSGMRGGIIFDLSLYIPEGDVAYGSPDWQDLVNYAIVTGHDMGLEIGFHNCPGWATSGGPWVPVEESMKRMVFSELAIEGGRPDNIQMPLPDGIREDFYRDVALLAIPQKSAMPLPTIFLDEQEYSKPGPDLTEPIQTRSGETTVFEFRYEVPVTVRSWMSEIIGNAAGNVNVVIETSMDGEIFEEGVSFGVGGRLRGRTALAQAFDPLHAKFFRVAVTPPFLRERAVGFRIASIDLLPDERIPNFSMISMGSTSAIRRFHPAQTPSFDTQGIIDPGEILDLTELLRADGTLSWSPPEGYWTLIRFGYTSTGATNHPAREGGQGFEVDKMDAAAVRRFFDNAVAPVLELAGGKLSVVAIDSWEGGVSNWTSQFPREFQRLRGYNLLPFLPVLTGRIVGSTAESYAFLQDFRVTITELIAENYHRTMQQETNKWGATLFVEPYPGWNMDEFKSSQYADLVASEFWIHDLGDFGTIMGNVRRTSAMVETIKEDKRLSAEAFTGRPFDAGWRQSPRSMKRVADSAMVNGVNDFTFHSFVHQPRDDMRPGFTHGRYGTEFGRHNIWWPMANAFNNYLARSGLLLRQGNRVVDFLLLKNEGPFMDDHYPDIPSGHDFLYVAPFTLLESTVDSGNIVTPGGGNHPALVLPFSWVADLALLEKLLEFERAGVAIIGVHPVMPAGRRDLAERQRWQTLVNEIFPDASRRPTTANLAAAMAAKEIGPDFSFHPNESAVEYVHRKTNDLDIYFIRNSTSESVTGKAQFRVRADRAQLWNPLDGSKAPLALEDVGNGHKAVSLDLPPVGSIFVVFGVGDPDSRQETHRELNVKKSITDWSVSFYPVGNDPFYQKLETLSLWNESDDDRLRYFAGIAVYESKVELTTLADNSKVFIDLGSVHEMARVMINGSEAGICWTAPDSMEITPWIKPGTNTVEIHVANTWVNRLIGDEFLPEEASFVGIANNPSIRDGVLTQFPDWYANPSAAKTRQRTTFVAWRHYDRNSKLVPAGLAGPVYLRMMTPEP